MANKKHSLTELLLINKLLKLVNSKEEFDFLFAEKRILLQALRGELVMAADPVSPRESAPLLIQSTERRCSC